MRSWATIESLALRYSEIVGIDLMRNYGQHNALLCGIRRSRNDVIITLDDDLQQPPEEIPRLLAKLHEGYDVVYGTPKQEQHGFWRNLSSRVTKAALGAATSASVAPMVSAFRAFRASVKPAFADYRSPLLSIDVLLTWATTSFASVTVQRVARRSGVVELPSPIAGSPHDEHDDGLQPPAPPARDHDRVSLHAIWDSCAVLRSRPVSNGRAKRSRVFRSSLRSSRSFLVRSCSRSASSASISAECTCG